VAGLLDGGIDVGVLRPPVGDADLVVRSLRHEPLVAVLPNHTVWQPPNTSRSPISGTSRSSATRHTTDRWSTTPYWPHAAKDDGVVGTADAPPRPFTYRETQTSVRSIVADHFPDSITDSVFEVPPYAGREHRDTTNSTESIFIDEGGDAAVLWVTGSVSAGFTAILCFADPALEE
jgi:hypothetical protein